MDNTENLDALIKERDSLREKISSIDEKIDKIKEEELTLKGKFVKYQ